MAPTGLWTIQLRASWGRSNERAQLYESSFTDEAREAQRSEELLRAEGTRCGIWIQVLRSWLLSNPASLRGRARRLIKCMLCSSGLTCFILSNPCSGPVMQKSSPPFCKWRDWDIRRSNHLPRWPYKQGRIPILVTGIWTPWLWPSLHCPAM